MKMFVKKNNILVKYMIIILILSFFFTILEYFGLSYNILSKMLLIINFILGFMYSFKIGIKSNINGYKSGLKSGIKLIIMFLFINLITLNKLSIKTIFYYLIILLISIIGGITGKNKQKNYSSSNLE